MLRSGKGFPEMPFALNLIYVASPCSCFAPCWFTAWIRSGKYREGGGRSSGARPRCGSATSPASGFTR